MEKVSPKSFLSPGFAASKIHDMIRAFTLALGISLCILGAECLVIEKAVMAQPQPSAQTDAEATAMAGNSASVFQQTAPPIQQAPQKVVEPPEWMPWSLLAAGAIIIIYSFTIPRRVSGG